VKCGESNDAAVCPIRCRPKAKRGQKLGLRRSGAAELPDKEDRRDYGPVAVGAFVFLIRGSLINPSEPSLPVKRLSERFRIISTQYEGGRVVDWSRYTIYLSKVDFLIASSKGLGGSFPLIWLLVAKSGKTSDNMTPFCLYLKVGRPIGVPEIGIIFITEPDHQFRNIGA